MNKIEKKLLDWYEVIRDEYFNIKWTIEDWIEYIKYMTFKMWIFRLFVPSWNDTKILKNLINYQFKLIGEELSTEEKEISDVNNWFDYLVKTKNDSWYREYKFKSIEQRKKFMLYFYKVMKLRKYHSYFPTDHWLIRGWPWFSLEYGFSYEGECENPKYVGLEDLPIHEFWWFKMFNWIFKFEKLAEYDEKEEIEDESDISPEESTEEYIEEETNQLEER